ncbi:TPA: radical SAM protein [Candidatus Woesearchaeota archaeon]|nr:radical SAM protein [Candidatus Woesearchaeota archaeon]
MQEPLQEQDRGTERIDGIQKHNLGRLQISRVCNQRCVFCSRGAEVVQYSPARIRAVIAEHKDSVCFEGGEPTLAPDVFKWIRHAKKSGVRDIVLVTNGHGLEDPALARRYLAAGVTLFNVNMPAHTEQAYDAVTQTRGNFPRRVAAVKNLIAAAGPKKVRLTFVVNTLMLKSMPAYAAFILREFPGLFYVEINALKLLGNSAARRWLVPPLSAAAPYLQKTFKLLSGGGLNFLTDGFPLCYMKGYEQHSIDAQAMARGETKFSMGEKGNCPPCARCTLAPLCSGPRKDYTALFGWKELRPSKLDPAAVLAKFERPRGKARRAAGKVG